MPAFSSRVPAMVRIEHPIIQAPMAGGATTPELVAAVSNAGALGSFAAATLAPKAIVEGVKQIRELTTRPFNVNLFILAPQTPTEADLEKAQARLAPFRAILGLGSPAKIEKFCEDNQAQIEVLLDLAPPVVSFTFGLLE
jgi:nitronate monooxygenase